MFLDTMLLQSMATTYIRLDPPLGAAHLDSLFPRHHRLISLCERHKACLCRYVAGLLDAYGRLCRQKSVAHWIVACVEGEPSARYGMVCCLLSWVWMLCLLQFQRLDARIASVEAKAKIEQESRCARVERSKEEQDVEVVRVRK